MKKIILAAIFLISGKCFAQTTVDTFNFKAPLKFTAINTKSGEVSLPDATTTTSGAMTAAQVQQVAALPPFSSNEISGTSYTITDADYGLTLPFTNTCSVTFSTLRNDFFCYVVRMGAGKITFTGAVSASTPLAVRYRQNTIKKIKSTIVIL